MYIFTGVKRLELDLTSDSYFLNKTNQLFKVSLTATTEVGDITFEKYFSIHLRLYCVLLFWDY